MFLAIRTMLAKLFMLALFILLLLFPICHFFFIKDVVPQSGSLVQQLVQSLMRIPNPFSVHASMQSTEQLLWSITKTPPTLVIMAC